MPEPWPSDGLGGRCEFDIVLVELTVDRLEEFTLISVRRAPFFRT